MSESHLPEDLASWPEDPFALLGVKHGVDMTALRRAYTRLLRFYKPEHRPEEFRRLRDAYEQVRRLSAFYEWEEAVRDEPPENESPDSGPPPVHERLGGGVEDQIDAAWERACQGEAFAAYRQLRELQGTHSQRAETYPRLYWLLKLHPEVDAARSASDWLAAGIRRDGAGDAELMELYRRELHDDPREAQSTRCQELLASLSPAARFAYLAEARWEAAATLADWDLIRRDLEACWDRFGIDDRAVWFRLQIFAVQLLAWTSDERAMRLLQVCHRQIEQFDGLKGDQFDELARLDYLLDLAAGWRALSRHHNPPGELLDLVRLSWRQSPWELRPRLIAWLEGTLFNPTSFLLLLDRVAGAAPAVAVQLQRVLESLDRQEEDEAAFQGRRVLIADFLISMNRDWTTRERFRPAVLQFCLTEFVPPQEVAYVMATGAGGTHAELRAAADLQNDKALNCLCQAHRVFWQQC